MSILIKGMEMPESCEECIIDHKFFKWLGCNKHVSGDTIIDGKRSPACPLTEVPEPHGDLIERNALFKKCEFVCTDDNEDIRAVRYSIIENAPIIIPASEE